MKISHVWPLLINPIWLPNSIDIFNLWACKAHNENGNGKYPMLLSKTRPPLERRKTLGHLRSINPNMINHYASQSQTCQLLKILKNIFFFKQRKCEKWRNQVELIYKIHIDYREVVYIYILYHIYVEFLASHFNDLSKFTGWGIIEELSIRRRPRTFLVSWGQRKSCKILLWWFIIMIWVLVCHNMYRFERQFGFFYRKPTI